MHTVFPQNNIEEKRQAETRAVMSWIRSIRFTGSASFHEVHHGCPLIRYKAQMFTSTFSRRTPLLLLVFNRPLLCSSCCHRVIGMHLCRIYSYYCMCGLGSKISLELHMFNEHSLPEYANLNIICMPYIMTNNIQKQQNIEL